MLNMSHRVGNYHQTPLRVSSMKSIAGTASAKFPTKVERETIHSGHFMVSTFEAEEALDDLDDSEIKMLDPEDPSLVKPGEANNCMEVQLYVPRKVIQQHDRGCGDTVEIITSHLEIETSLTKLFKCMNLAYSQKLTSPKWNHFKGVRLRWKDKIRLNNVIWRCWHMQFILKRKTLVCQFASPLDVDIHSNPQSVVLEGKYWKRQLAVIKAEYRKWRRNYKSTKMGCLTYDTKSEFDFLEWSPINDRHLMTNEDWTTDTLFSAINVPFPFPDSREIARGAGIADFIQPSLGPLQPNLDDIDLTFVELLQNTRLPSVPEEGSEEMLKNVDYGFSEIMGTEQLGTNSTINVTGSSAVETTLSTASDDANMIELDTPLSALEFVQMEEEMSPRMCSSNNAQIIKGTNQTDKRFNVNGGDTIMGELSPSISLRTEILQHTNRSSKTLYASPVESNNIPIAGNVEVPIGTGRQCSNDFPVKKGRISKNSQRPFRREPHNYDKAQPTLHQTNIYQQILAEQHKIQQFPKQDKASVTIPPAQQQNSQSLNSQLEYPSNTAVYNLSSPNNQFEGNNSEGVLRMVNDSNMTLMDLISNNATLSLSTQCQQSSTASATNARVETPSSEVLSMFNLTTPSDVYAPANSVINTYKPHPHLASFKKSASTGNYFNLRMACHPNMYMPSDPNSQGQSSVIAGNQTAFIGPSPVGNQLKVLANGTSASSSNVSTSAGSLSSAQLNTAAQLVPSMVSSPQNQIHLSATDQAINADAKEIYRSNSLPLNVILPKMESRITQSDYFAMPIYHPVKNGKNRSRSNSINHSPINAKPIKSVGSHFTTAPNVTTQLQTATSEPMLNSAISHLLTKSHMTSAAKHQSASTSGISTTNLSNAQNKLTMRDSAGSLYISPSAPTDPLIPSSSHLRMNPMPLTMDDSVSRHALKHSGEIQDQQQPPHKSPKKSDSLPKLEQQIKAINSLSAATNKSLINYPLTVSNVTQASSSFQNQTLSQTDVYHDLNASLSPTQTVKNPRDSQRRVGHIHAEQKRRYNIKNGFDQLHDLIPQLQQSNVKLSKAAMLQKGVEHIKHLRNERNVLKQQMDALRLERDALNSSLSHLHSILPANGAPVTRQGTEHVKKLYEEYVHYRTMENWKFWILGLILEPLLTSYTTTVSSASMDELRRTAFLWVDQHCSLIDLRPAVSNKLKYLSMNTDILSDPPSTLQEEVIKAMNSNSCQHPNLHGT